MSAVAPSLRAEEPQVGLSPAGSAQELFDRALAQRQRGELREACQLFEASVAVTPSPHGWLQVGNCREPSDAAGALDAFEAAAGLAARVDDPMRRDAYLGAAKARIDALAPRVPTVTFRASSTPGVLAEMTPPGGALAARVDRYDQALRFNPGRYRVRAWAAGFSPHVVEVELLEGDRRIIALPALSRLPEGSALEAAPAEPVSFAGEQAHPAAVDASMGPVIRALPVSLAGGGVLLVLSGVVMGQLSTSERRQLERECSAPDAGSAQRRCSSELAGTKQRMENLALAADVLWVGGSLLAAAGIGLFIVDQSPDDAPPVAAACAPSRCGLSVTGQF